MRSRLVLGMLLSGGLLAVPALSGTSCFVPGFELVEVGPTGPGGGSTTSVGGRGGAGGSGGAIDPCSGAKYPPPPAMSDGGPDDVEFVVAFRSIEFGETMVSDSRPSLGYDLDGLCTCRDDGPSCVAAMSSSGDQCDGFGGIDNSISVLFSLAASFDENFRSSTHSKNAEDGGWSILVRVEGYNGKANDDQVKVSMFTSSGMNNDPCLNNTPEETPKWDGSDRWPIMTAALEPIGGGGGGGMGNGGAGGGWVYTCGDPPEPGYSYDSPKFFDLNAYVNDFELVASLPEAGIVLDGDGGAIDLTAGFLTGRLRDEGGAWYIDDGVLAGRWAVADVFVAVSNLGSGDDALCTDDPLYQSLKTAVCSAQDITSEIKGPTAPCDAVSFGMGFSAEPAQLGFIYIPEPSGTAPCPVMTDPANDSCDVMN